MKAKSEKEKKFPPKKTAKRQLQKASSKKNSDDQTMTMNLR